jgi:hypothetical protein
MAPIFNITFFLASFSISSRIRQKLQNLHILEEKKKSKWAKMAAKFKMKEKNNSQKFKITEILK